MHQKMLEAIRLSKEYTEVSFQLGKVLSEIKNENLHKAEKLSWKTFCVEHLGLKPRTAAYLVSNYEMLTSGQYDSKDIKYLSSLGYTRLAKVLTVCRKNGVENAVEVAKATDHVKIIDIESTYLKDRQYALFSVYLSGSLYDRFVHILRGFGLDTTHQGRKQNTPETIARLVQYIEEREHENAA